MINIAVVGLGYWGPNLARNVDHLPGARLHTLCDKRPDRLKQLTSQYPDKKVQTDYEAVLADREVEAVIIATPVHTHYKMTLAALRAGKHVLVEKPMAQTSTECRELITLAEIQQRTLMVGHVFIYNAAVQKVKEYIQSGELGEVYYIYSQRLNLGIIRQDVNALWNFGPHDISIICHWLETTPERVMARGYSYLQPGIEDVIFMNLDFPGGIGSNIHLSWLDPGKVRRMTVVGSEKMVVYDDVSAEAKITVYDKGVTKKSIEQASLGNFNSFGEFQLLLRAGDILIPKIKFVEPLKNECQHFVESIQTGQKPLTDGYDGLRVVQVLEVAQQSIQTGQEIEIHLPNG
jgi:predicted dehydrogenase